MTAQDIVTAMRFRQNPIIFLVNNGGYTIEVEIHDGAAIGIQPHNCWTTDVQRPESGSYTRQLAADEAALR